jgi:hypothetical protein
MVRAVLVAGVGVDVKVDDEWYFRYETPQTSVDLFSGPTGLSRLQLGGTSGNQLTSAFTALHAFFQSQLCRYLKSETERHPKNALATID